MTAPREGDSGGASGSLRAHAFDHEVQCAAEVTSRIETAVFGQLYFADLLWCPLVQGAPGRAVSHAEAIVSVVLFGLEPCAVASAINSAGR